MDITDFQSRHFQDFSNYIIKGQFSYPSIPHSTYYFDFNKFISTKLQNKDFIEKLNNLFDNIVKREQVQLIIATSPALYYLISRYVNEHNNNIESLLMNLSGSTSFQTFDYKKPINKRTLLLTDVVITGQVLHRLITVGKIPVWAILSLMLSESFVGEAIREDLERISSLFKKELAAHPNSLFKLHPRKFEELITSMFIDKGYSAELTPFSSDGGTDIILYVQKNGIKDLINVQCKRNSVKNKIGPELVREMYGVQHMDSAKKSIIVTTSSFTKGAKYEAKIRALDRIELIDFAELKEWLNTYLKDIFLDPVGKFFDKNVYTILKYTSPQIQDRIRDTNDNFYKFL